MKLFKENGERALCPLRMIGKTGNIEYATGIECTTACALCRKHGDIYLCTLANSEPDDLRIQGA